MRASWILVKYYLGFGLLPLLFLVHWIKGSFRLQRQAWNHAIIDCRIAIHSHREYYGIKNHGRRPSKVNP